MSKSTQDISSLFDRLFANLTPEDQTTFTPQQIEAMRQAFGRVGWKKHPVDFRVSMPLPGASGLYLVVLAGQERREVSRVQGQRRLFWRSVGLFGGTALLAALGWLGATRVAPQLTSRHATESFPTVLPWINSKADCLGEGKLWRDGECWDEDHSPMF